MRDITNQYEFSYPCWCPSLVHVSFFLPSLWPVLPIDVSPTMSDFSRGRNIFSHELSQSGTTSMGSASQILPYLLAATQICFSTPSRRVRLWVCCCCPHMCRPFEFYIMDHMTSKPHRSFRVSSACVSQSRHSVTRNSFWMTYFPTKLEGRYRSIFWMLTGVPPPCWSVYEHKMVMKGK